MLKFWYLEITSLLSLKECGSVLYLLHLEGFTDSDYVGNLDNRKSTSGYIFTYQSNTMLWRSNLQECTTLSTTEAKYIIALADFCHSQSMIHLIRNPVYHAKTKHIEITVRCHHIWQLITDKKLEVRKIDTKVNIVDCLTKPHPDHRF